MPTFSRRTVLHGAGVALALPFLESLAPRGARAQVLGPAKRFITVFFPMGTAQPWWTPSTTGVGDAWALSSILEPFTNLKAKSIVVSGLENYSCYSQAPDSGYTHGRLPGCFLTSSNIRAFQEQFSGQDVNSVSVDQAIAQHDLYKGQTPLDSLALTLGTSENACDGPPCSYSRNISWSVTGEPNWPLLDPGAVFDRIVGSDVDDPEAQRRRALNQSILDSVLEGATAVKPRLGVHDQNKVEEFLESVRALEQRVPLISPLTCSPIERPTFVAEFGMANTPGGYNKGTHADLMNDLVVLALQCDVTRVITHMMENERSEFVYDHISKRTFTETTSTETGEPEINYHGASAGLTDDFATITRWNALKTAELCERLNAIEDAPGVSILDNTVVMHASCMDGVRHEATNLPVILVGGLSGILKTDQHIAFAERPLRDLYFTLMNQGFNLGLTDFGNSELGAPIATLEEILA